MTQCTQRAIEQGKRRKRPTLPTITRWLTAAAILACIVGTVWFWIGGRSADGSAPIPRDVVVKADINAPELFEKPDASSETIEHTVTAQHPVVARNSPTIAPVSDVQQPDELDMALDQMTDEELLTLDDGYYIDEIPEY